MTNRRKVQSRNTDFTQQTKTSIWQEVPSSDNPYIAEDILCHGYELLELANKRSFVDVLYLLFRGELPSIEKSQLLERLMIILINPGPRHPATRAGMSAAVSKTAPSHLLPISLSILGGSFHGADEVEKSMRFLKTNVEKEPNSVVSELYKQGSKPEQGDWHIAHGFGSYYGGIDIYTCKIAEHLSSLPGSGQYLQWGIKLSDQIQSLNMGWLSVGVTAAAFLDLGFHPRAGAGLYQYLSAPGLLAHSLEMADKEISDMPFLDDEHYVIED